MTPIVISLIYNVLFGGLIGVVGNIYELTIRNFVIANREIFQKSRKQKFLMI